jgi:hypothetical protein
MKDRNVINIGLCIIKRCGMYSKEYKNWIACENKCQLIVESIESFKEYWDDAIALVNHMAILAANHGCSMTTVDDDASLMSYGILLANFGTAYATIHQEPSYKYGGNAKTTGKHPAVLLGRWPVALIQLLCPCTTTRHIHRLPQPTQRGRWFQQW